MNLNRQRGIAQLVVIAVMAFLALGLPLTTKLVQQSQENRSQAASVCKCSKSMYSDAYSCSKNGGRWNCGYSTPTRVPTKKPIPTRVPTKKPTCTSGLRRCNGNRAEECVNSEWKLAENCSLGCIKPIDKMVSCKICKPGDRKCRGGYNVEICDKDGLSWIKEKCSSWGCSLVSNKCLHYPVIGDECSSGRVMTGDKCAKDLNSIVFCDYSGNVGVWKLKKSCKSNQKCDESTTNCVDIICEEYETKCKDSTLFKCFNSTSWIKIKNCTCDSLGINCK